jgi:hypothetical protein
MINEEIRELPVGAEVFTADGERLGEIKEVRAGWFKVDAAMQPDYWLPMRTVDTTVGNRVTLNFKHELLSDYKQDEPLAA